MLSSSRKKVSCPIPINNGIGGKTSEVNGAPLNALPSSKHHRRSNTSANPADSKPKIEPASRVQPSANQRPSLGTGRVSTGFSKSDSYINTTNTDAVMPALDDLLNSTSQNVLVQQRQLKKLLSCLDNWEQINDDTLLKLINQIKEQDLENLDEKMSPLLQQILNGNWPTRAKKIVKAMEDFLVEVLIARSSFGGIVIQALAMKFQPAYTSKTTTQRPDEVPLAVEKVFQVAHRNLRKVFEAFPMRKETCVKTFSGLYPYMTKSPHVHYCYVKNLLEVIKYAPECQLQILHLIIHKLTRIDVNIPREDIEECYKAYHENSFEVKNECGGHNTFNSMELDGVESPFTENPLIQIVDVCLNLVLEHLSTITFSCTKVPEEMEDSQDTSEEEQLSFFTSMLSIFESEILPTFGVNNIQYLYFHLINLKPKFATTMLDFLWKKVISLSASQVVRIHSAAYISGILSRSSVISVKTVKRWLTRLADWANEYIDKKVSTCDWSSVNVEAHGVFYAVCQAIFYVFAFRNKDLIGSRKCIAFTRTLNLGRLVTSDLNPLKVCSDDVAVTFVSAAHQHQVSYCHTVLERNQTVTIPLVSRDSMTSNPNATAASQLESFFPFDEFYLRRSKLWIDPHYRIYEEYYEDMKVEKTESWSSEHGGSNLADENEDSIEMELGTSFTDKFGHRSTHFYCNGRNPFKFKTDVKEEFDEFMDI